MKITLLIGKIFDIEKDIDFPIRVIRSARAKNLTLRIDTKKRIPVLTVPRFCSKKKAVNFVYEHKEWIDTHLAKISVARQFADGDEISLFGNPVKIKHDAERKRGVFLEDGVLYVSGDIEFLSRRVRDYIKEQSSKFFLKTSRELAAKIDCEVKRVFIKDSKTRWASCSTLSNLNFSWRIALAPDYVIDYLVAHEVSHLKHHNHSEEFWKCVVNLTDNRARGETWLRRYGNTLNEYE